MSAALFHILFLKLALIFRFQLLGGSVAMQILTDILILAVVQHATQFAHDLLGFQIPPQRFQRAHMEGEPPGFVELAL